MTPLEQQQSISDLFSQNNNKENYNSEEEFKDFDEDDSSEDGPEDYDFLKSFYEKNKDSLDSIEDDDFLSFDSIDNNFLDNLFDDGPTLDHSQINSSSSFKSSSFSNSISNKESSGNYKALPFTKGGKLASSAVGKYQFLWDTHKPWIERITGVHSKQEFANSPEAQEKAFSYWEETTLNPVAKKYYSTLSKDIPGLTMEQAKKIVHFAGEGNIQKAIKSKNYNKPLDAFGSSILSYIK